MRDDVNREYVKLIREASSKTNIGVSILAGPKFRTGDFEDGSINLVVN